MKVRTLILVLLASLFCVSVAVAQSSITGGWRKWCEVNPYVTPPEWRCWYTRRNPGKGRGEKK